MDNRTVEEQIHARLRELADQLRQLRHEMQAARPPRGSREPGQRKPPPPTNVVPPKG